MLHVGIKIGSILEALWIHFGTNFDQFRGPWPFGQRSTPEAIMICNLQIKVARGTTPSRRYGLKVTKVCVLHIIMANEVLGHFRQIATSLTHTPEPLSARAVWGIIYIYILYYVYILYIL